MNLTLMALVVEKKGKFFVSATEIKDMKAGKADNTFQDFTDTLKENNLQLIKRSASMYVIEKVK